ncbi:SGNH/GDSL hydrolase family protein [Huintestinicola sp.]|uniref:SGNH/GDSL hydrolase family protein n=1 Tax=Huintestinicola sp. TaxID=2981661 RepID=UPI003D7CD288
MRGKTQYSFLNKLARSGGIVIWGSTTLAELPVNELLKNYDVSRYIYNRSIPGLTLSNAEEYLDVCVLALSPEKLILNLGEEDIRKGGDVSELIEQYRWLLYRIHLALPGCALIITGVRGSGELQHKFNSALEALAREFGCLFCAVDGGDTDEEYGLSFIGSVRLSLYDDNMNYTDIASRAVVSALMH